VLFTDNHLQHLTEALSQSHDVWAFDGRTLSREHLQQRNATAIFLRSVTQVNSDLLDGTGVQFVGSATAGIDHVDTDYLRSRNITFASAPGCNANAVAEYVMDWIDELQIAHTAIIGIVGFGHIGKLVAKYARAYGMHVLISDPPLQDSQYVFPHWCSVVPLAQLMETSDIVTLHAPLTDTGPHPTLNLVTSDLLDVCKSGALIINAARGGLIDERHLADLVSAGRMNAVLDVFINEPNIDPYVVERIPHLTPHIAGYTVQAKEKAVSLVYEAFTSSPWTQQTQTAAQPLPTVIAPLLRLNHTNFDDVRRLTPLRKEHRTPPTWEELDVLDP